MKQVNFEHDWVQKHHLREACLVSTMLEGLTKPLTMEQFQNDVPRSKS